MMDQRLAIWIRELRRYNGKLHLMGPSMLKGIEDELEVMLPLLKEVDEPVIADLGSGSGLPAIPYKLLHPQTHLYLIERSVKKCTFLQHVIESIHLEGVEILPHDPLHDTLEPFDAILARSFSPLSTLVDVCQKILRPNGKLYYLFTGNTPDLTQAFESVKIITRKSAKYTLNLGVFSRIPS
jgi:16S rRNA (guanine(527)-N(7))-methyltransferase RsmG